MKIYVTREKRVCFPAGFICSLFDCSENKNPPLENNVHIFTPPCNILYIFCMWYRRDVIVSKYAPSVRGKAVYRIFVAPFLFE